MAVWGLSFVFIERTVQPGPVLQQEWVEDGPSIWTIYAVDQGQQHLHRFDVPLIYPIIQPALFGAYALNGVLVPGWRLGWHHRVNVKRAPLKTGPAPLLHYHQHKTRRDGQLEPPAIKPGVHW